MAITFNTPIVMIAFPFVFTPRPGKKIGQEAKYSCMLVVEPEQVDIFRKPILEAAIEQYGARAEEMLKNRKLKSPLRPGSDAPDYAFLENKFFINASSKDPFDIVDRALNAVTDPKRIYSGVFVRARLGLKTYDVEGNKGIGAYLNGLQLVREGARVDGRVSARKAFDDGADLGAEDAADTTLESAW